MEPVGESLINHDMRKTLDRNSLIPAVLYRNERNSDCDVRPNYEKKTSLGIQGKKKIVPTANLYCVWMTIDQL